MIMRSTRQGMASAVALAPIAVTKQTATVSWI